MIKSVNIFLGICSLLLFTEKVKAAPVEKAAAQNVCWYVDQGADYLSATTLAGQAHITLLNPNFIAPNYVKRNMRIIVNNSRNINKKNFDMFEFTYTILQDCLYAIFPFPENLISEEREFLNNCLQDKEWCRKNINKYMNLNL